ncbi:MAG TPA: hypothetical protein VLA13_11040 [Massilibacterium sp.]|nr:hypothetical protein [Massilibacterium sp.]
MKYKKEHFKIAKKNGIGEMTVYSRVNNGWSIEEAITRKVQKKKNGKWLELARKNGIKENTFYGRLRYGMTEKEAATKPVRRREKKIKLNECDFKLSRTDLMKEMDKINDENCKTCSRNTQDGGMSDNLSCRGCEYKERLEEIGRLLINSTKQNRRKAK